MELDRVPLWRGDSVPIKQLIDDFARYLYLPRLRNSSVLVGAVRIGLGLLTWEHDSFAFAESFDEKAQRYRGLQCGRPVHVDDTEPHGILVKPAVARQQLDAEKAPPEPPVGPGNPPQPPHGPGRGPIVDPPPPPPRVAAQPTRFHGSVTLDSARVGRDASRIADEVLSHLSGLVGADVRVTLEIEVNVPGGVPENVVRTVTENSRTLKFGSHGFEKE